MDAQRALILPSASWLWTPAVHKRVQPRAGVAVTRAFLGLSSIALVATVFLLLAFMVNTLNKPRTLRTFLRTSDKSV